MKKIAAFSLLSSAFCLTSSLCLAMPNHPELVSGTAEVSRIDPFTMEIRPSDHAILQYKDFQIGRHEKVRFVQSSSQSCVLNRITGENPSQILGSLESNGKVFLVNPNGVYFGPNSTVHVGSLIVSTLNMADEDFLTGKYRFSLDQKNNASLVNEGLIHSAEGSIVLLSSHIRNLGTIEAKAGNVVLASGEHVTLDFTGDGLIQFSVEGSLKEALIEHLGEIHSSTVSMKLPVAKKAIHEIVNMDGMQAGDLFIEEHGVIKFAAASQIQAKRVDVEGAQVFVQGSIDASDAFDTGGDVHLYGREIVLEGALINTSGLMGGGKVLIGGEFQGKGQVPYASKVVMNEASEIYAEAIERGCGGLVVLWSQDETVFSGTIYAQGGLFGGNGGLVETSSKGNLRVEKGVVNTLDSLGQAGQWLLDPTYVNIVSGSSFSYGFGNTDTSIFSGTIGTDYFLNLSSNVTILASSGIHIYDSFSVTGSSASFYPTLTFQTSASGFVSVGDPGDCSKTISIVTSGGSIDLVNIPSFFLQCPLTTITTNGGDLRLNSLTSTSTCYDFGAPPNLTINAGSGAVVFNAPFSPGNSYLVGSIIVNSARSVSTNSLYINGALTMPSIPLQILGEGTSTIHTNNHDISIGSIDMASGYSGSLNLVAGASHAITVGDMGSIGPFTNFSLASDAANSISLSSVTTTGGDISIPVPAIFSGSSLLTAKGGAIFLSSASSPDTVVADGDVNFSAGSTISGSFSSAGEIHALGPLVLGGSSALTSSLGVFTTSTISGAAGYGLTLSAPHGSISIGGDIANLHSFRISQANDATFFGISTTGGAITIGCPVVVQGASTSIRSSGGPIIFEDYILPSNAAHTLMMDAGSGAIAMRGLGTQGPSFGDVTLTGGSITITEGFSLSGGLLMDNAGLLSLVGGNVYVGGDFHQIGSGAVSLGASVFADGSIAFLGGIQVASSIHLEGAKGLTIPGPITTMSTVSALTLNGGNDPVTIASLGSDSFPMGAVSITASQLDLEGSLITSSSVTISSPVTITGNTTIRGPDGITLQGAVTTTSTNPSLTLDAGSSPLVISGLGTDLYPLGTLSMTGSSLIVEGNIVTNGALDFSGPVVISAHSTLQGSTGISLSSRLVSRLAAYDLTLISSGSVSTMDLGTGALPLGNISIRSAGIDITGNLIASGNIGLTGTSITLGPNITAGGNIEIHNSGLLRIPQGIVSVTGNFLQSGIGSVSLGTSIATPGSISFEGAVTITSHTTLEGGLGITVPGSIIPNSASWNLNLNAGNHPLSVQSLGSISLPLGTLTITAAELTLGGDIYTSSSISLASPVVISANTSLTGPKGIIVSNPITTHSSTPSLMLTAVSGPIDIQSLGSNDLPLGAVSLTGASISLRGNIASTGSVSIAGPVFLGADLTLRGDTGITLQSSLLPRSGPWDLDLQASSGAVSIRSLGTKALPLGDLSISGLLATTGGNITASSISITAPITLSGSCTWTARGGITTSEGIDGHFGLTLDGVSSTQGVITIGGSVGETSELSYFTIQNTLQSNLSSIFTNGGGIQISSSLLLNNHAVMDSSGGNIALNGSVDSQASSHYNLSMAAGSGTVCIGKNIGDTTPLGSFTLGSARSLQLSGPVLNTLGSISIYSPLISRISTLNIKSESYGDIFIARCEGTESGLQDIGLSAVENVQVGPMGSASVPLGTISILGAQVSLEGSIYAQGSLGVRNSGKLSIEVGDVVLGGGFNQEGLGTISLGKDITAYTIAFASPITLTHATTWTSHTGIVCSSPIDGTFDCTLVGTTGNVVFENVRLGSMTPLASLNVQGRGLVFSGNVGLYSTGDIHINLPGESRSLGEAALTMDTGSSSLYLGPIGLHTALGSVDITAGLLLTQGIATAGGSITIQAPIELNSSQVIFDTTRNDHLGADITLNGSINSSASTSAALSIVSGRGEIVLSQDVGSVHPLKSLFVASEPSLTVPNITVLQAITMQAPLVLSHTPLTTFTSQNHDHILLSSIDGTASGMQSFTIHTNGTVSIGPIGKNRPLQGVEITSPSQVHLQDVFTQGPIVITSPALLSSSAMIHSSGSPILLGSMNALSVGGQSLTVNAGSEAVLFTENIGSITPLENLIVEGGLITLESPLIYALGTQSYLGPVVFFEPSILQAKGDVVFHSSLDAVTAGLDLSFYMGSGGLTFVGAAGDAPFGNISIFNATAFSAQEILAGSLRVTGGCADISLYGDVILTDPAGMVLDGKSIHVYGDIQAPYRFFRSRELVSALDFPFSLSSSNPTPSESQYIDLIRQTVGSQNHPIEVFEDFVTGSYFRVDLLTDAGSDSSFTFWDRSRAVTFDGETIVNNLSSLPTPMPFPLIPKTLFYVPGLYSSWDNLSNDEYFQQSPVNLGENPRARNIFYTYTFGESI